MVPLPDCASGEWGPTKATRLFGLIPITHQVSFTILMALPPNYPLHLTLFLYFLCVFCFVHVHF